MTAPIEDTLQQYFGFDTLRHGQSEVISRVVAGHSAAAIFPTGSGKSLCYQLPALHLPHLTLVISPLLALMKDQLAFLHSKGIAAASIDSTQDRASVQQIMQQARSGELRILMISVERLKNERFRQFIAQVPISLLVVDEAHCISEWGHNFRPDYLKLPHYRHELNIPQVLLLTATATQQVVTDMSEKFAIPRDAITITGFYRPNLDLFVHPCPEQRKPKELETLILSDPSAPTIVYVTLQKTAENVAQALQHAGINATAYHAGLANEQRESIQSDFMQGHTPCIVATIAFGMGIDKADIRRVIHYDLPKSIENYSQEIGRAGRDGQRSDCITLANLEHVNVLENFIYGDTPDKPSITTVIEQIYQCEQGEWEVMMNRLSRDSHIRLLPLKTLLVYLELEQIIESQYSYFATYRFKLIDSVDAIIGRFNGERRQFVAAIFQCSVAAKIWFTLDFDRLWQQFNADRRRVVAAIDYFHEQGWIELESKQITDVYRVVNTQTPVSEVVERLHQLFRQKEHSEIKRIQVMLDFFASEHCLSQQLAHYFSDENAPQQCGHCSVCAGYVAQLPKAELAPLPVDAIKQWTTPFIEACAKHGIQLTDAAISRFLCGLTNPMTTKVKANKMSGFAQLERYPFAEVKLAVSQQITND
ncbi:MAG: RecQ family ATP-dependent DNA helicase [Vibrio sp.]